MIAALVVSSALLWVLVLALCTVTLISVRAIGSLNERLVEQQQPAVPPIMGQPLPDVTLANDNDDLIQLNNLDPRPGILFLLGRGCPGCTTLVREARSEIAAACERGVPVAAVVLTSAQSNAADIRNELDLPPSVPLLRDSDGSIPMKWQIQMTPQVLILNKDGKVELMGRAPKLGLDWVRTQLSTYPVNGSADGLAERQKGNTLQIVGSGKC